MKLRKLRPGDVPRILEWMTDPQVNRFFQFDPAGVSEQSVARFVQLSADTSQNLHLAVAGEDDVYLGTISLKNIDPKNQTAEYAISMRPDAQGIGAARFATGEILRIAFEELGLFRVYLNVYDDNARAIRFYEKCGFRAEGLFRQHLLVRGERKSLQWFAMLRPEWLEQQDK